MAVVKVLILEDWLKERGVDTEQIIALIAKKDPRLSIVTEDPAVWLYRGFEWSDYDTGLHFFDKTSDHATKATVAFLSSLNDEWVKELDKTNDGVKFGFSHICTMVGACVEPIPEVALNNLVKRVFIDNPATVLIETHTMATLLYTYDEELVSKTILSKEWPMT